MGPKTIRGWRRPGEDGARPQVDGNRTGDRIGGRETGAGGDRRGLVLSTRGLCRGQWDPKRIAGGAGPERAGPNQRWLAAGHGIEKGDGRPETRDRGTSDRRLEILVRLRKYGRPRIRQRVVRGATFLVSLDSTVEAIRPRPTTSPFPSHPSSTFSPMSPVALMFPSPQPQFIRPTPQRTRTPSSNATR